MHVSPTKALVLCGVVLLAWCMHSEVAHARYLPTRGGKLDRLDKLRELLKEVSRVFKLLETEIEKEEYQGGDSPPRWHPESKLFYKREVQQERPQDAIAVAD